MLDLFWVEFLRSWLNLRRYPSEFVGAVVSLSTLFLLLFLGAKFLAGPGAEFGERTEAILVGFLLWILTIFAYNTLSFGLSEEAQTGTLEQVFLTPYGPIPLLLVRNLAGLGTQLLLLGTITVVLMLLTGARLSFPPLVALPILTVLLGSYGLGFAMAAWPCSSSGCSSFWASASSCSFSCCNTPWKARAGLPNWAISCRWCQVPAWPAR